MNSKLIMHIQSSQESDQDQKQIYDNIDNEQKPLQQLDENIQQKAQIELSGNRFKSNHYQSKTIQGNMFFNTNSNQQNNHQYLDEITIKRQKKIIKNIASQNVQDSNNTKLKPLKSLRSKRIKQQKYMSEQKIKLQQYQNRAIQSSKKMLLFQVQDESDMTQSQNDNQQSDKCSLNQQNQGDEQTNQGQQQKKYSNSKIINQIVYDKKLPEKNQKQNQQSSQEQTQNKQLNKQKQQNQKNQTKSVQEIQSLQEIKQLKKKCLDEISTGRPTKQLKLKLRDFFLNEYKPKDHLQLKVTRKKDIFNFFTPQFHMQFLHQKAFVMACKKTLSKPISTFLFSSSKQNFNQNSLSYLGKMKSNISGKVVNILGTGYNPQMANCLQNSPRQILATVQFRSESFGVRQPRQFTVYLKKPQYDYYKDFTGVTMYSDELPLNQLYLIPQNKNKILVFKTRKPKYCNRVGGYILNFQGKVKSASIKNFILEEKGKQGKNVILFGKISDNQFVLQISNPLPPIVGLGVALCSFDSRIGSQ